MQEIVAGELRGCSSSFVQFWVTTLPKEDQKQILAQWNTLKGSKVVKRYKWVHNHENPSLVEEHKEEDNKKATSTQVTQGTSYDANLLPMDNSENEEKDVILVTNGHFPETPVASNVNSSIFEDKQAQDSSTNETN